MSPRTAEQNEIIREQSKTAILSAAFELFATKGYDKTSIAQIAKQAGVSKGLIYNYFDSKEDLLAGLVQDMVDQFDDLIQPKSGMTPKEILKQIIDQSLYAISHQKEWTRLMILLGLQQNAMSIIHPLLNRIRAEKLKLVRPLFESLGYSDPDQEVMFLGAVLDGMALGSLTLSEEYPMDSVKKKLYSTYNLTEI